MNKHLTRLLFALFVCLSFILFPRQVQAKSNNNRLYYDNMAYRYKRSTASSCVGTGSCLQEASVQTQSINPNATIDVSAAGIYTASDYANAGMTMEGFYIGQTYTQSTDPSTGITSTVVKNTYFPIAINQFSVSGLGAGGTCNATQATNLNVTTVSPTSQTLTWTPGANGTNQLVYVGNDLTAVKSFCQNGIGAGTGCVDDTTNLDPSVNSFTTTALSPGDVYYWIVVNYQGTACASISNQVYSASSCSLNPSTSSVVLNSSETLSTDIASSSIITSVTYSSSDSQVVSVSPTSDTTSPYTTTAKAVGIGSQLITTTVNTALGPICTDQATVAAINQQPWWQVKDGDLQTGGDLGSVNIPEFMFFDLKGPGGFPGVPGYGGTTDLTNSSVSEKGWLANSKVTSPNTYNYQYFANQIPAGTVINTISSTSIGSLDLAAGNVDPSTGYYWYKYDGSTNNNTALSVDSAINIGNKKVILFVNAADLDINAQINLTKGSGFFMAIVGKDITVDPSVGGGTGPNLEGIYEADGQFYDNTNQPASNDSLLWVRGSIAAYGGLNLDRDIGKGNNEHNPSELFEYAPDQILLFPPKLGARKINWKEIAP